MLTVGLSPSVCKAEKVGNKSVKFFAMDEDNQLGSYRINLITEDQQTAFFNLLSEDLKSA